MRARGTSSHDEAVACFQSPGCDANVDKLVASFGVNDASAYLAFFDPIAVSGELKYL